MNTRQIPGRDKIGSLAPGKYKTFEGTEISIENCLKAKVKDLVVEGKTYQNLVTNLDELAGNVYTTSKYASIPTKMFKTNTTYTVITTINESVYSSTKFGALLVIKYTTIGDSYIPISLVDGTFKIKFTTGAENPTNIRLQVHGANDTTSSFKLDNLIILEGDYTNIDLPNSINGIESVAEREKNVLSIVNKGKNLFNPNNLEYGNINTSTGKNLGTTNTMKRTIDYISVKSETPYMINSSCRVFQYDKDKNFLVSTTISKGVVTTKNTEYIKVHGNTTSEFVEGKKIQLEERTVATSYEPYREPSATTLNLPIPLRSLPNGTCDTIEGNKLVQRAGKVVLDENIASNFKQVNTMQVFRWEYFFDTKEFVSGICDNFLIKNVQTLANENKGVRLSGNNFRCIDIKFPNDTGFDINAFRTWLSENPVTIYYELAEPIIHDLEIPIISTTKGTNIITTSNNIKPKLSMKVKVKK